MQGCCFSYLIAIFDAVIYSQIRMLDDAMLRFNRKGRSGKFGWSKWIVVINQIAGGFW